MMANKIKQIGIVMGCLAVVGCSAALAPAPQRGITTYEIVDQSNQEVQACAQPSSNAIFYLSPVRAEAPYDSTKMFYQQKLYQLNTFNYSQWTTPPSELLTQVMVKKVANSCLFRDVVTSHAIADANYRLVPVLLNLRQEIESGTATAHLVMFAELINLDENKIVATKIFDLRKPTPVGPVGYVAGINQLTMSMNQQLLNWLKQNTK